MDKITNKIDIIRDSIGKNNKIIAEYEGIFDQNTIKKYSFLLREKTKKHKTTQTRIFHIFIELAQNVGYYSDDREIIDSKSIGKGLLIIYENNEEIGFIIGNKINAKAYNVLERKCKIINSLSRDSLRELKRFQRNLIPGTNGGAHIGLIMVALTTRKKIEIYNFDIDKDMKIFYLNVKIDKI